MASVIADAFAADESLQAMAAHCQTDEGARLLADFDRVNRAKYPHIIDEVAGIAAGSEQPIHLVMLANLAQEVSTFVKSAAPVVGCTDVHVLTSTDSAWGHTEDVLIEGSGYIVHSTLVGDDAAQDGVVKRYTAFCYPGCVAGWAWGYNAHGVAFSINALTPSKLCVGLAASFVSRDVLDAENIDDAIARAAVLGQAGGQRFNLGSVAEPGRRVLIEAAPRGCEVRWLANDERCCACNVYLLGTNPTEVEGRTGCYAESSHRRLARVTALLPNKATVGAEDGVAWIRRVLTDAGDASFPIWRNKSPPDYAKSDHMVVFDLIQKRVDVFREEGFAKPTDAPAGEAGASVLQPDGPPGNVQPAHTFNMVVVAAQPGTA